MKTQTPSLQWLSTLLLTCFLIICLTGVPALLTDPIPHTLPAFVSYAVAYFAQNILFVVLLGAILFPIFYLIRSDALKIMVSLPFVAFALLFSFMNAKVFAFWRLYVNSALLDMYFSKGGGSQIFEVHSVMYFWIIAVAALFVCLSFAILFFSRRIQFHFNFKPLFVFFLPLYCLAQMGFIFFCYQDNMRLLQYAMKVPYFYNLSWVNGLEKMGVSVFPKKSNTVKLQTVLSGYQKLHYPLHSLHYHLPSHPLNVLIIMVDSLRYDMVNANNMPNVTQFANHANQFLNNISGGDCTRPGVFSLFYGMPSTYWHSALEHHQESIIIRAFQDNRYHLGLFASASLLSPPFNETVFAHVKNLQTMTPGKTAMDRDRQITTEMQDFLNEQAKSHHPFFGFMFYDAPHAYNALTLHTPFHPIGFLNYFSINQNTPSKPFFNLYQNAVFADDALIATILQTVRDDHLLKNTVVIITADHGQEFNDYGNNYWEHASGFSKYQVRTPMLIAWPNRKPTIFHYQTTHFDLAPTLLKRVLGVKNPASDYSVGDDFFTKKQLKSVIVGNYAYYALITQNDIIQFHDSGLYRLTDLKMNPLRDNSPSQPKMDGMMNEIKMFR